MPFSSLTRIVLWAQQLLAEVLAPGETVVDLTAGKGQDTFFLQRQVGPKGRVIAFDLQPQALEQTARRLLAAGILATCYPPAQWSENPPSGVHLLCDDHAQLENYVKIPVGGVIANLGYLPGSDQSVITRPESTLAALARALTRLRVGGRLAVVTYPGHPGGAAEAAAVSSYLRQLGSSEWEVLVMEAANRRQAPGLVVAQRR